jgi:putative colanic acid biosynthesis glycosyltransferase WcaI
VPVLMSLPEGEATALVRRAGCGVCVPPEDPVAMATEIARLVGSPNALMQMSDAARASAPIHSRDSAADRMLAVFGKIAVD